MYNSMHTHRCNWFLAAFSSNDDGPIRGNGPHYDEDKARLIIEFSKKVSHSNNT
jgi:hypothetical protein